MALRSSVQGIRVAGLERTARLAGESFGYEELGRIDQLRLAQTPSTRWVWAVIALFSVAGLCLLALR